MQSKKSHKKIIARNLLIIDLGLKAGLRRSEISNLLVQDIDLARNYLIVRQGKGMKDRIVDLTPSLHQAVEIYIKGKRPAEHVFNLASSTISGIIRWAAKKAGIGIHTHSLRHFFGQTLVDTGTDLETVRRLMGHKNIGTTQQYIGRTDDQRRAAIERLESPVFPPADEKIILPAALARPAKIKPNLKVPALARGPLKNHDEIQTAIQELDRFNVDLAALVSGLPPHYKNSGTIRARHVEK